MSFGDLQHLLASSHTHKQLLVFHSWNYTSHQDCQHNSYKAYQGVQETPGGQTVVADFRSVTLEREMDLPSFTQEMKQRGQRERGSYSKAVTLAKWKLERRGGGKRGREKKWGVTSRKCSLTRVRHLKQVWAYNRYLTHNYSTRIFSKAHVHHCFLFHLLSNPLGLILLLPGLNLGYFDHIYIFL